MFLTALAAGYLMLADAAAAAPAPAAQAAAQPAMKRVCVKSKMDNTNIPKVSCYMQPVKSAAAEPAKVGDVADASTTH